jgi:hypothetical protein
MRAVGGIVVGLVAATLVTILVGFVGLLLTLKIPANVRPDDMGAVIDTLANLAIGPLSALAIAWLFGALAGAWSARRISGLGWVAWIVILLVAVYVLLNTLILPMPGWMQVVWIAAPFVGGLIGNHLGRGAAVPATAATTETPGAAAEL